MKEKLLSKKNLDGANKVLDITSKALDVAMLVVGLYFVIDLLDKKVDELKEALK